MTVQDRAWILICATIAGSLAYPRSVDTYRGPTVRVKRISDVYHLSCQAWGRNRDPTPPQFTLCDNFAAVQPLDPTSTFRRQVSQPRRRVLLAPRRVGQIA